MLQGFNVSTQFTPPSEKLSITSAVFSDTQHILVTVQNSLFSTKRANVTMIQIQAPKPYNSSNVYPPLPMPVGIGNTTMLSVPWNWTSYTNTPIDILIYYHIHTNESYATYALTTPSSTSNYQVYLSIPSVTFNASLPGFNVTIQDGVQSKGNANVTEIAFLLADGTIHNTNCTSLPYTLIAGGNETFTCQWNWITYSNKNIVILVYTDQGLKAIYVPKTPF
jgi:hypothetical protein